MKPVLTTWISLFAGGKLSENLSFYKEAGVGSYTVDGKDKAGTGADASNFGKKGSAEKRAVTGATVQTRAKTGNRSPRPGVKLKPHKYQSAMATKVRNYPGMPGMKHQGELPMIEAAGKRYVLVEQHAEDFDLDQQDDFLSDDQDIGVGMESETGDLAPEGQEGEPGAEGEEGEEDAEQESQRVEAIEFLKSLSDEERKALLDEVEEESKEGEEEEESEEGDESEGEEESEDEEEEGDEESGDEGEQE